MMRNNFSVLAAALLLSACAHSDMQGVDPKEYYSEHPVETKVEARHMLYTMDFRVDRSHLSGSDIDNFQSAVSDISPEAVESVVVKLAPSQMSNKARQQHISKLLRGMGYSVKAIRFESSKDTTVREAALDITYAAVVNPRCPDWRVSPVTTYSNTTQPNFGCATTVNLGAMVVDPHDLEKGNGSTNVYTPTAVKAVQDYRSGDLVTSTSGTASSDSGSSSSSGTSQ
jgi:pilus biogenesis lipoprotein CpaD